MTRIGVAVLLALTFIPGLSLLSVQDEIALGREAQRHVKSKVPEVTDPVTVRYIRGLGQTLAAHAPGPAYPYSFSVADYREINAFALPGGPVWVHRGAIEACADEAQLAGVLAHEIAHIARRHAAGEIGKRLVTNGLLGLLGALLGNYGGARAAQAGAQLMAEGYMLRFSRDDEREADAVGVQILRRAGWDPHGMVAFMETLRRLDTRNTGSVAVFLSSHPAPAERVGRLTAQVRRMHGGRRDSAAFTRVHARLERMPAARRMTRTPDECVHGGAGSVLSTLPAAVGRRYGGRLLQRNTGATGPGRLCRPTSILRATGMPAPDAALLQEFKEKWWVRPHRWKAATHQLAKEW